MTKQDKIFVTVVLIFAIASFLFLTLQLKSFSLRVIDRINSNLEDAEVHTEKVTFPDANQTVR